MFDDDELVGLAEAANLLGVTRQALGNWRQRRDDFPQPLVELKAGPVWRRADIMKWAEENGLDVLPANGAARNGDAPRGAVTVAFLNMKGGVGKSTLAANLGWYCAMKKQRRVLLVDLDPQFNLSQYVLGTSKYEKHLENDRGTVLDVFERGTPSSVSGKRGKKALSPEDVIATVREWPTGPRLDLLPSRLELSWTLKNPHGKERMLANFLDEVHDSYDLVLLDCPPTDSILTEAAYLASDAVLIPVRPEFLSTIGLPLVLRSLQDFAEVHKQTPEVLGIVFNAAIDGAEEGRSRAYVKKIAKQNGWYVFQHGLTHSQSYPAGSRKGTPIFNTEYARSWKIDDFLAVAQEFAARVKL